MYNSFKIGAVLFNDSISIRVDAIGVKLRPVFYMLIREPKFLSFPLRYCRDLNCWLSTLQSPTLNEYGMSSKAGTSLSLSDSQVSVDDFHVSCQCLSCSNQVFQDISHGISSPGNQDNVGHISRQLLEPVMKIIVEGPIQKSIDRAIHRSQYDCPYSGSFQQNSTLFSFKAYETQSNMATWTALSLALIITFTIGYLLFWCALAWRRSHLIRKMTTTADKRTKKYDAEQHLRKAHEDIMNSTFPALGTNSSIPFFLRILMPLILVGNVAIFLLGHTSNAVTIQFIVSLSKVYTQINIYQRSISQLILELWNSGVKGIAVLTFIFLVVLPYIQQAIVLSLWMTRPKRISVKNREDIYRSVIALSKWNLLPLFIFNISTSAVNISFRSPPPFISYLTPNIILAQPRLYPDRGIYMFLSAQFILQCSCLAILHYHRFVRVSELQAMVKSCHVMNKRDEEEASTMSPQKFSHDSIESLRKHRFYRGTCIGEEFYILRRGASIAVVLLWVFSVLLLVSSFVAPSLDISTVGVIGAYLDNVSKSYSAGDIVRDIFQRMHLFIDAADKVGMGLLLFLVICVFVGPFVLLIVLLVRWFSPLSRSIQTKFWTAVEVLDTFQYLEVYFIGLVLSTWLMRSLSIILNRKCGYNTEILAAIAQTESNRQCFLISADLSGSSFTLVTAVMCLRILRHVITSAARHQESDIDRTVIAAKILQHVNEENQQPSPTIEKRRIILRFNDFYLFLLDTKQDEEYIT